MSASTSYTPTRPFSFYHTFVIHPVCPCVLVRVEDTDGLGGSVDDRSVYGVENSSMFLECSPKSQRALIYWQLQKPNDDRKHEVRAQRVRMFL